MFWLKVRAARSILKLVSDTALCQKLSKNVARDMAVYRARHFLPTLSTVSTAVRRLVETSQIDSFDGVYRIIDPIFAHHLRRGIVSEPK